jgi:hypothetical protein
VAKVFQIINDKLLDKEKKKEIGVEIEIEK